MKKHFLIVAMVICFLVGVNFNCFARDDSNLQDRYWKLYFKMKDGSQCFYEHQGFKGNHLPATHQYKDSVGYLYFYEKVVPSQEMRDDLQKDFFQKEKAVKNVKLAYLINFCEMDCKDKTIQLDIVYFYSDTNEFIECYDMRKVPKIPIKGSRFEKIPFDKDTIEEVKQERECDIKLKKYRVEKIVRISDLSVNPYEFKDHIIAVEVNVKRRLSETCAIFYSGYQGVSAWTGVPDQIVVTDIPRETILRAGSAMLTPSMVLALKGKGTKEMLNSAGGLVIVPHFQWIGIISGKQKSVFEK
jgi:hypothetical protein